MRLVAPLIAQSAQLLCLSWMVLPHPRQRLSRRGLGIVGSNLDPPLASRLWRCVNRVGNVLSRVEFRSRDHNLAATHSAMGATARPQLEDVSESFIAI